LKTEAGVIVHYLRLCFWPRPLVIDYFDWPIALWLTDALVSGALVVVLLGATVWALRRRPWLGFLGAWFFILLAPTSSFLPSVGEVAAERRMYLPSAAVVTMAVVGAFVLGKRLFYKPQGVALGCVAAGAVVVLFTSMTIQRNQDYRSDATIWQDAVEKRPNNPRAHNNLGLALAQAGRLPEAISHYEQALGIQPDFAEAHNNLALALVHLGRLREAIEHWEQAVRIKPDYVEARNNLGLALAQAGRLPEAISHYEQALRVDPDFAEAHCNLGNALFQAGKLQEAIGQYQQALRIKVDYAEAHYNLGVVLERLGQVQEAVGHYEQALRLRPDFVQAQKALVRARAVQ
jgi:Flp pilus assembly protein TadD